MAFWQNGIPAYIPENCAMKALEIIFNCKLLNGSTNGSSVRSLWSASQLPPGTFSSLEGVTAELPDYGSPSCACPLYQPFFSLLENTVGLEREKSLFVGCYDYRITPNADVTPGHQFLTATKELVERAYELNGGQKVILIGHSNGPIMIQYFLLQQTPEWREKYVHIFQGIAGNWAGQGSFVSPVFTGYSFRYYDAPTNPAAAPTLASWPSSYFAMAQPKVYGDKEKVIAVKGKYYGPLDYERLFKDAGSPLSWELFRLSNGLSSPDKHPGVDVYSTYGYNLSTDIGAELKELKIGTEPIRYWTTDGDGDQEYIDNESDLRWANVTGFSFRALKVPNVQHLLLPYDVEILKVITKLVYDIPCQSWSR